MTVLADFTIEVEYEQPRSVRVIVYDSLKGLRIAASRYDNIGQRRSRRKQGRFSDTLGICHRFEQQSHDGEQRPQCAIIRLAYPYLGVGMICHELTHAAVWIRELKEGAKPLVSDEDEPFVWLVGELVRQATNGMRERGVFEKADLLDEAES